MRFLPVFLDLQTGPVLLVGSGDLARAKLRLLAAAGARVRWFATDGDHDVGGLEAADAARIELANGDPLTADLERRDCGSVRRRGRHRSRDVGAGQGGRSARQRDGRSRRIRLSFFRPSSIAAMSWWRSALAALRPWWRGGCASASRPCCRRGSAISQASSAAGARPIHGRIAEFAAAPPLLGARGRRPDRRAGARRTQ